MSQIAYIAAPASAAGVDVSSAGECRAEGGRFVFEFASSFTGRRSGLMAACFCIVSLRIQPRVQGLLDRAAHDAVQMSSDPLIVDPDHVAERSGNRKYPHLCWASFSRFSWLISQSPGDPESGPPAFNHMCATIRTSSRIPEPLDVEAERNHIRKKLSAGEKFNSLLSRTLGRRW